MPRVRRSDRFRQEAVASLPVLAMNGEGVSLDAVFDGLELQRMRLRVDQRVPEWAPRAAG